MVNQQMDFHNGYIAALEEVYQRLTKNPYGRTEAYENAVTFIEEYLENV